MFEHILEEQNPHWKGEFYEVQIKRSCFPVLIDYLESDNIVTLTGVRRGGKSTLLQLIMNYLIQNKGINPNNILHLRLEETRLIRYSQDPENLQRIFEDYLKIFAPTGLIYILLDEVQFFKDWPVFVKSHFENKQVKFVVTGSNSKMLSTDLITLLSGRTLSLEVFPLSFAEFIQWQGITIKDPLDLTIHRNILRKYVDVYLECGGFPGVVLEPKSHVRSQMLNSYAKTVIYRDVIPRMHVRKTVELETLYGYLVSNIGKLFSYHKLAELFQLSDKSIRDYIAAFEDAFLLFEIDMFSYSVKKQLRNLKKIYAVDVGQVNAIAFQFSANHGRLLENLVFLELKILDLDIFYYKTEKDLEVDFCIRKGVIFSLVQVAWEIRELETKERELNSLFKAMDELNLKTGVLITLDQEEEFHLNGKIITMLPIYKFSCLSSQSKLAILFPGL